MLHVSLLGEQAITEDGTSVQVRSSRALALVAYLAARAGQPQSRPCMGLDMRMRSMRLSAAWLKWQGCPPTASVRSAVCLLRRRVYFA